MPSIFILVLLTLSLAAAGETSERVADPATAATDPGAGPTESPAGPGEPTPALAKESTSEPGLGKLAVQALSRLRPIGFGAAELLASASESSSIVADLLKRLDQTDVVVYLTDMLPWTPSAPKSHLVFLTTEAGIRYLMIRVDRSRLSPSDRVASLGHELQHALEVAAATQVRDASGMADLYRRIGWEAGEGRFESAAARSVGDSVRKQVMGRVR